MRNTTFMSNKIDKLRVSKNTAKSPEKYSLFWVEDTIGQDWFIITPNIGDRELERKLAEELHGYYEDIEFAMRKSTIYPNCHASFVCEIQKEAIVNTDIVTINNQGESNNLGITYYEGLLNAQDELIDRIQMSLESVECELRSELHNNILEAITDKQKEGMTWLDSAYEYFKENFTDDNILQIFLSATIKDSDSEDMSQIILYMMYYTQLYRSLKEIVKQGYNVFGSFHGQNDILTKIETMFQLDDGLDSFTRVYIYNGVMYEEQASQREIDRIQDEDEDDSELGI